MTKVYCDTGAYIQQLNPLEREGLIQIYQFKYENRNRNIKNTPPPSRPTWKEMNYTWEQLDAADLSWNDLNEHSDKFPQIVGIVGNSNLRDAKHLDSAYMEGCRAFLTTDKDDICANRASLFETLDIRIFHVLNDWDDFLEYCRKENGHL